MGVKAWQATVVAFQSAHPHPNLPPVRGKGYELPLIPSTFKKRPRYTFPPLEGGGLGWWQLDADVASPPLEGGGLGWG